MNWVHKIIVNVSSLLANSVKNIPILALLFVWILNCTDTVKVITGTNPAFASGGRPQVPLSALCIISAISRYPSRTIVLSAKLLD